MLPFCVKPMWNAMSVNGCTELLAFRSFKGQSPAFLPPVWTGHRWRPSHRWQEGFQAALSSAGSSWGSQRSGTGSRTKSPPSSGPEHTLDRGRHFESPSPPKASVQHHGSSGNYLISPFFCSKTPDRCCRYRASSPRSRPDPSAAAQSV